MRCTELEQLLVTHISVIYREQLLLDAGCDCVVDKENLHNTVARIMERDPRAPSVASLVKQMGYLG